jgi:plasmid segregation protein ParM
VSNTKPVIVAIDDGFDFTKVVTANRQVRLPTSVARASRLTVRAMSAPRVASERCYEIEGTAYVVGPDVLDPINTQFEEFPYSGANLAIATEALRQVLPGGTAAHVITGLPLNRFYTSTGEQRESVLERKVAAWRRPPRDMSGVALPQIVDVTVIPEAVAAWFDYAIGPDLQLDDSRFAELTAVVDIGGRTTDVAVVREGDVYLRQSGTLDVGTLTLAAAVRRLVEEQFPGIPRRSHRCIETAIRRGAIRIADREIDVSATLEREKRDLFERIAEFLVTLYGGSMTDIQRVLFVGGGSVLLEPHLRKRFPGAAFPDDPQMANARGMWKSELHSLSEERASTPGFVSQEPEEGWVGPIRAAISG